MHLIVWQRDGADFSSLSEKGHLLKCKRVPTRENLADNCLAAALQMVLRDARDLRVEFTTPFPCLC